MDPRYSKTRKSEESGPRRTNFGYGRKRNLAVIHARAQANEIPMDDAVEILRILETKPIDIVWWKAKDEEIHHDLVAFVEERRRHLPENFSNTSTEND